MLIIIFNSNIFLSWSVCNVSLFNIWMSSSERIIHSTRNIHFYLQSAKLSSSSCIGGNQIKEWEIHKKIRKKFPTVHSLKTWFFSLNQLQSSSIDGSLTQLAYVSERLVYSEAWQKSIIIMWLWCRCCCYWNLLDF